MENLSIRQYLPSDIDRCRSLWIELTEQHRIIYNDSAIGGETPGLYFDKHLARIGDRNIWVAEINNLVIGLIGLVENEGDGEIDPVIVSSEHRNKGIGNAMVRFVIEEAKKRNLHYLSVKPVARNIDAIVFYHNVGFKTIGQIELFMELSNIDPEKWVDGIKIFNCHFMY